jgi:cation:H+ antiporter
VDQLPVWANALIILISIVIIGKGADVMVEAAARLAARLGISELIIGLTVVSLGTSAPEFAVTLAAAIKGKGDISVGNIVGSNIFNLGFILGGCAMIQAIRTSPTLFKRDGFVLGSTTVLLLVLIGWDLKLDRMDGCILLVCLVLYLARLYKDRSAGVDEGEDDEDSEIGEKEEHTLTHDVVILVIGLIAVVGGSHVMVESAIQVARVYGISEWVIGVTIVAAGTSAPEFATTISSVLKGRHAIGAGNLIGSDIFNLLGVLGVAGVLRPVGVDPMARWSLLALCGMVFLALFFVRTDWKISRLEGAILVLVAMARWGFDLTSRM